MFALLLESIKKGMNYEKYSKSMIILPFLRFFEKICEKLLVIFAKHKNEKCEKCSTLVTLDPSFLSNLMGLDEKVWQKSQILGISSIDFWIINPD